MDQVFLIPSWLGTNHKLFGFLLVTTLNYVVHMPWKSKTKQRIVFRMIHVKDSLLPRGKVSALDFQGPGYVFTIIE